MWVRNYLRKRHVYIVYTALLPDFFHHHKEKFRRLKTSLHLLNHRSPNRQWGFGKRLWTKRGYGVLPGVVIIEDMAPHVSANLPRCCTPESQIKSETHVGCVLKSEHWHKTARNYYAKRTQKTQTFDYLYFRMDGPTCRYNNYPPCWHPAANATNAPIGGGRSLGARWLLPFLFPSPHFSLFLLFLPVEVGPPLRLGIWGSA